MSDPEPHFFYVVWKFFRKNFASSWLAGMTTLSFTATALASLEKFGAGLLAAVLAAASMGAISPLLKSSQLFRRMRDRLADRIERSIPDKRKANRQRKSLSDVLSDQYLSDSAQSSVLTGLVLLMFGGLAIFIREYSASVVCLLLGLALLSHNWLTAYRVRRGYFGANMPEAIELIEFAVREHDRTGAPPPSKRIFHPYDRETASAEKLSGAISGAR